MGRKPIKATQAKYQKYIDVIMDDLGLTGKVYVEWRFSVYTSMGGDAKLYDAITSDGKRFARIRLCNDSSHEWTLTAIMHELRHIWQSYHGRLGKAVWKTEFTKRGKKVMTAYKQWDGVEYKNAPLQKGKGTPEYYALPWEIDAREYEKKVNKLFPKGKLLELENKREYIGVVGKVKFYKTHA